MQRKCPNGDICQPEWLTKNTSYENVEGVFVYEKIQSILKKKNF